MKDLKILVGFIFVLASSTPSYAADEVEIKSLLPISHCDGALDPAQASNQTSSTDLDKQFHELAQHWKTGWTERGFLGFQDGAPDLTAESYMYALKNGLMWWNVRIYFAKSIEEAKAHDALVTDTLVKGVYVIGADESEVDFVSDADAADSTRKAKGEDLRNVLQRTDGFIEFVSTTSADGLVQSSIRKISMEEINSRVDFKVLSKMAPDKKAYGKNFFAIAGWAATKKRGLLHYEEWEKSSAIQRGRKLARKLVSLGYQIKVNGDFQTALNMTRDQERFVQKDGKKVRMANSRYKTSKPLYDAALAMYSKDLAFSVEIYRPDGKMVGGSINFITENLVTGDTIFYDLSEENYIDEVGQARDIDAIDLARLVDVVTFDYMAALGLPIMDIGQVTEYSESIKGRYVPREEYLKKIANLPKGLIRLPSYLDPFQYPDLNFADLAKGANVKGLTKSLFLGGLVLATEYTQAKALEYNLVPAELVIFVVKDSKEAEAHAKLIGPKSNVIYFMSGQSPMELPLNDGAPANELVALILKNGGITIDLEAGKVKPIPSQRFKNILNSRLSTHYMSWKLDSELGPHVIVKGWKSR